MAKCNQLTSLLFEGLREEYTTKPVKQTATHSTDHQNSSGLEPLALLVNTLNSIIFL